MAWHSDIEAQTRIVNHFLLILSLVLTSSISLAQLQWGNFNVNLDGEVTTIYTDTDHDLLYIGGKFGKVNGHRSPSIAVYDGVSWDTIGDWYAVGWVYAIAVYNDTLYIGGYQGSTGGLKKWNGTTWTTVGGTDVFGQVYDLEIIDNELWVAGNFDSIGNVPAHGLARWDGDQWQTAFDFPEGLNGQGNPNWIVEISQYNGDIYISGNLNPLVDSLSSLNEIARWDGQNWTDVGGGIKTDAYSAVNRMVEFQGELYVMGDFMKESGNADDNIMRWNGSKWLACGGGIDFGVYDAVVYDDRLWVTGGIETAGGIMMDGLAIWDGEQWCSPGNLYSALPAGIGVYRDTLVMGGAFTSIDGDSYSFIANWTGIGNFDSCGVLWPVAINSPNTQAQTRVYPNPVQDQLILEFREMMSNPLVNIISSDGQLIYSLEHTGIASRFYIDTKSLSPGFYLLQFYGSNEIQTHPFVKN